MYYYLSENPNKKHNLHKILELKIDIFLHSSSCNAFRIVNLILNIYFNIIIIFQGQEYNANKIWKNVTWISENSVEYCGFRQISNMIKSAGFEHWTTCFENGGVTTEPLILDYIAAVFITHILSHFLGISFL